MSTSWIEQVPVIVKTALMLKPKRILDVGMGAGKYGFLLRDQTDFAMERRTPDVWKVTIDGVEGYGPSVGNHQKAVYNNIYISEANAFLKDYSGVKYDLAMAIDIIEHLAPEAGVAFVQNILNISDYFLLSTPRGYYSQEGHENILNRHISWWPGRSLRKLAKICNADIRIIRYHMSNIAVFSKTKSIPNIEPKLSRPILRYIRDLCVPEIWYYKAIGGVGPSI